MDYALDHSIRTAHLMREHAEAQRISKNDDGRAALIVACRQAVANLVAASTVTTNLLVDIDRLAVALADAILASPRR